MVKAGDLLTPDTLTVNERVLLHLRESGGTTVSTDAHPLTQPGIAEAVGIRVNHVSRAVRQLMGERLVAEGTARVRGEVRKRKVYTVTPEGHGIAQGLMRELGPRGVLVTERGTTRRVPANDARKLVSPPTWTRLLGAIDPGGALAPGPPAGAGARPIAVVEEGRPSADRLLGREREVAQLRRWIEAGPPILQILGPRGIGKSALASACLPDDRARFWWSFREGDRADPFLAALAAFLAGLGKGDLRTRTSGESPTWRDVGRILARDLKDSAAILVLDDAHLARGDLAPFVEGVCEAVAEAGGRVAVTAEAPLARRDALVAAGTLREMRLRGLDKAAARALLPGVPDAEFEKSYRLTEGNPLSLKLLAADADPEGYTPEERALLKVLRMRQDEG